MSFKNRSLYAAESRNRPGLTQLSRQQRRSHLLSIELRWSRSGKFTEPMKDIDPTARFKRHVRRCRRQAYALCILCFFNTQWISRPAPQ